jgi:pimeloyl-ACP methyl ester carboxylesterase
VLNGGPGQDSNVILTALAIPAFPTYRLRQNRQVIVFDQRGVGASRPSLACPEITENEHFYESMSPDESKTLLTGLAAECRDRLVGEGVDLGAYTSAQSAADLAAMQAALGYDQIDLYGVSYGTRLALTVLRDHPEGIRSVILDANYPPQSDLYADAPATFNAALQGVFAGCAEDTFCALVNADLPGALQTAVDQLNASPLSMTITPYGTEESIDLTLDGISFLNSVVFAGLYATPLIPLVPYVITSAASGIMAPTEQFLMILLASPPISYGMYYSIQCSEEIPFADETIPATPVAETLPILPVIRDYFQVDGSLEAICGEWPVDAPNPIENQPVTSDVPTLIVDGEFDPITSPANAALIAEGLPNSTVAIFPGGGHSLLDQPCPISIFVAFLADPTVSPDLSCSAAMGADFSPDLGL